MSPDARPRGEVSVFRSKRNATRYQILVEVADRQPAVSQREIADAIGITAQAVSDYLSELADLGQVEKLGRGRYEVTKEGVDWLISQTTALREFTRYVSEEVVGGMDVETALAGGSIREGQLVSLSMRDGVLHATTGADGGATAVAVTDADEGTDVGVTEFEGILEYDPGIVTVLAVPRVEDGGSREVDAAAVSSLATDADLVAVAGIEALAAARAAGVTPAIRFGTPEAVEEAATKGLDVLLLSVTTLLSAHTDRLREASLGYEVRDGDG